MSESDDKDEFQMTEAERLAFQLGWSYAIAAAVKLPESHANKFRSKSEAANVRNDVSRLKVR